MWGKRETGKTTWARSLGPHFYFEGVFSGTTALREYEYEPEYAVFDDIRGGIKFFHAWKAWLGCQREISVKRMYHDPEPFIWGRPAIWCANRDPRIDMRRSVELNDGHFFEDDLEWIEDSCIFIHVDEAIATFRASTG